MGHACMSLDKQDDAEPRPDALGAPDGSRPRPDVALVVAVARCAVGVLGQMTLGANSG